MSKTKSKVLPDCFKDLATEVSSFYGPTEIIIIRLLIRFNCLDERDLEEKLQFDTSLLQSKLSNLKYDRIIRERIRMERDHNGKSKKILYYFINYRSLSDVIKYKLLQIAKAIQESTSKRVKTDFFKCTNCSMTFDEIEAGELFDPLRNDFYCTHCRELVKEDTDEVMEETDVSTADFNTRTTDLERLLKECDNFVLDPKLFEPEPEDPQTEVITFAD